MTKKTLLKYLDKKNWKLTKDQYEGLCETSGDLRGYSLSSYLKKQIADNKKLLAQYEVEGLSKKQIKEADQLNSDVIGLENVPVEDICNELFVRGILDGWVGEEIFYE